MQIIKDMNNLLERKIDIHVIMINITKQVQLNYADHNTVYVLYFTIKL